VLFRSPGPNATSADIQKAIIRSQKIGQQSNSRKYTDSYREYSTQRGISVDRKHSTQQTTSK